MSSRLYLPCEHGQRRLGLRDRSPRLLPAHGAVAPDLQEQRPHRRPERDDEPVEPPVHRRRFPAAAPVEATRAPRQMPQDRLALPQGMRALLPDRDGAVGVEGGECGRVGAAVSAADDAAIWVDTRLDADPDNLLHVGQIAPAPQDRPGPV